MLRTAQVLRTALHLGLTSFGGPLAHLGYFERTYVRRLGWLSGEDYGALVALCQVLPGPSSSQVGFLIGLHRAGWPGALAAWLGFTLPSALLLYGCAVLSASMMTSAAMMRLIVMMGALFVVCGLVAFQLPPRWHNFALGLGFGSLHLLFGILIGRTDRVE